MVTVNGGTLEHAWQTAGIYDFVAVLNFPDPEAEFWSRNEVCRMGHHQGRPRSRDSARGCAQIARRFGKPPSLTGDSA